MSIVMRHITRYVWRDPANKGAFTSEIVPIQTGENPLTVAYERQKELAFVQLGKQFGYEQGGQSLAKRTALNIGRFFFGFSPDCWEGVYVITSSNLVICRLGPDDRIYNPHDPSLKDFCFVGAVAPTKPLGPYRYQASCRENGGIQFPLTLRA